MIFTIYFRITYHPASEDYLNLLYNSGMLQSENFWKSIQSNLSDVELKPNYQQNLSTNLAVQDSVKPGQKLYSACYKKINIL